MSFLQVEWNPRQKALKEMILKPEKFGESIKQCLELHSMVHSSEMSNRKTKTLEDELWTDLKDEEFCCMPTKKDVTIAWNTWHVTRIEDLTANILIANGAQVINSDEWSRRLNTSVRDTGNAMNDDQICQLSSELNMKELRNYRISVGRRTREIIMHLQLSDMKRRFQERQLERITGEGGVLEARESRWLVGFWGRKNVAGILLMPITRHQIVHLNDSLKLKAKMRRDV
jgi:hypothetical protein